MMNRNVQTLMILAGAALVVATMTGCPKPPPPPPPPPAAAPPPPPPVDVALDALGQELKADPRVQFATGLVVSEDRTDLGKAVVRLADALARGDDKAMSGLLTRKSQIVLNDLKSTGAWEESTKKIEAVRVVLLREGVDVSGVGKQTQSDPTAAIKAALDTLPQAQKDLLQPVFDALPKDDALKQALKDQLPAALEQLKAAGVSEEAIGEMTKQLESITGAPEAGSGSAIGLLIAIQEPGAAYLLGFQAERVGDAWVFAAAPSSPETRARVSAFDGIGPEGFRAVTLQSAIADPPKAPPVAPGASGATPPAPSGDGSPSSPPADPAPPTAPAPTGPGGPGPGGRRPGGG